MFFKIAILFLVSLKASRCSLVIDALSQDAVYVADYCPKMEYCVEGAHVMCMYYNPHNKMGPRCSNPQNISINAELASKLLDVSNAIRSKLAFGKEKGKDGKYLPRAYGMYRLKWDSELATFAQVLANQCILRHDLCRATKRFPDPGQTAGLVRFTYPDWYPVSRTRHFTTPGLSSPKVMYAVMQSLKSWYAQKSAVTENMVLKYPDWSLTPNNQAGRLFLEMTFASATHMGCGISGYTEFAYSDKPTHVIYNSIQVFCNFSSKPRKGTQVYTTKPPTGSGYTIKCGCPTGSKEDADCLCNEFDQRQPNSPIPIRRTCNSMTEECEPTVVLLPIFTVEDAPSQKLMSNDADIEAPLKSYLKDRFDNTSRRSVQSQEIFDMFAEFENEPSISHVLKTALSIPGGPVIQSRQMSRQNDAMNGYFDRNSNQLPQLAKQQQYPRHPKNYAVNKKTSIFTRVAKFQLPSRKSNGLIDVAIKKDVPPRKDFSNVQKLVNTYLQKLRINDEGFRKGMSKKDDKINKGLVNFEDNLTTETSLNRVEERVMSYNQYLKQKLNNSDDHRAVTSRLNEENENKLITLLDTLERAVKHIELDGNEKEIFDAKLRNIYGTVVGKPAELLIKKQTKQIDTDLGLENELMELNHFSDDDKTKHETTRLTNDIRRYDINHISDDERKVDTHYNDKRVNGIKTNYENLDNKQTRPTKNQYDDIITKDIFRDNKHNNILSSDENVKPRTYDKYNDLERGYKSLDELNRISQDGVKTKAYYAHKNEEHEDPLSMERRKYYQDKLENLERRMHDMRNSKHRNDQGPDRQIRRMRPSRDDMQIRPSRSKSQIDPFYMPDRARYVHGFR